jgi:TRAP-type C4-dicarboxylate transport system permease small subunit
METLFRIEKAAGGLLLLLLTATIFLQVVFRFLFDFPLAWSEELSRYSFIWLTMAVAPICVRLKANISTGTSQYFSRRNRLIIETVCCALTLVFAVVLLVWGSMLLEVVKLQRSPAIGLPMYWVYGAIPAGAALTIIELVVMLRTTLRELAAAPAGQDA